MSTPGSSSGIFNIAPQEDDDDLRVPSTCDPADHDDDPTPSSLVDTVVETAQQKSLHHHHTIFQQQQQYKASTTPSSSTKSRTVSDFHLYVDEEALANMTTTAATTATMMTGAALPSPALSTAAAFPSMIFNPTFMATPSINTTNNFESLECDWMNRSLHADEFTKIFNDNLLATSIASPISTDDVEDDDDDASVTLEVSQVPFESLLELADLPLPAPLPEQETRRKRGRPNKDAELPTAPVAKRAKKTVVSVAPPSTPRPNPLSRPTSDDPEEMERYTKYRQSNNEAACKSRLRRKEREKENAQKAAFLEVENAHLKQELSSLQSEVAKLKGLLEAHLKKTK